MTRAFKVERRGRPRKPGKRYPGGKLVTDREVIEARVIAFRQPHRQSVPERLRADHRAESPFGRMMLSGGLGNIDSSDGEPIGIQRYDAGMKYAVAVRRYRAHVLGGVPNSDPQSIGGFMQPGSYSSGKEQDAADIKEKFDNAFAAVMEAGQRAAVAVKDMVVFGKDCPIGYEKHLIWGLDKLISHYGLTRRNR
jgi:hypothetical protein